MIKTTKTIKTISLTAMPIFLILHIKIITSRFWYLQRNNIKILFTFLLFIVSFCKNLLSQYYKEATYFEFNVKRTQKKDYDAFVTKYGKSNEITAERFVRMLRS